MITTKGIPTTAGSRILVGYTPVFDSTVAARCKGAGLPILGKTNLDEFMGSSTENSAFADPEPLGPRARSGRIVRRVGRGGRGRAGPLGLGTDTGGSVKQPASLCGVAGLRPTYGTVSRYGSSRLRLEPDQVGPLTKTVRDNARLYEIIAGKDPCDPRSASRRRRSYSEGTDLAGVRIGVPKEMNEADGIDPGVSERVNAAIRLAEELGAEVEETSLSALGRLRARLLLPRRAGAEASSNSRATTASATATGPRWTAI